MFDGTPAPSRYLTSLEESDPAPTNSIKHKGAAFISTSGDLQGEEMAQIFVKALPRITHFLKNHTKPFIAKIAKDGSVSLLFR